MLTRIRPAILLLAGATVALAAEGDLKWFKFNKQFITAHYNANNAFGSLRANSFAPAANVHTIKCSGNDGELHVGILNTSLAIPAAQQVVSGPANSTGVEWGLTAELPNAKKGPGPQKLADAGALAVTFQGYFRVWDEGHDHDGSPPPSNPNHVLELHPAWGFTATGISFNRKSLVAPMTGYHGYGASKFRPMFTSLDGKQFLNAFQDNISLFVQLRESPNFFQLPVVVKSIAEIDGGHELIVDVFSDANFQSMVHSNLRAITAAGTGADTKFHVGDQTFFLGFFSANLNKLMQASTGATAQGNAVSDPDSLEFFVFGRPLEAAVSNSSCQVEVTDTP